MREPGEHLDYGVEDKVDHQGHAASVTVGHQSKDERAHRAEREGKGDGESDLRIRAVKLLRDGRQREDHQKEVKGVKRPPEEAGEDGRTVAVLCRRGDHRRN